MLPEGPAPTMIASYASFGRVPTGNFPCFGGRLLVSYLATKYTATRPAAAPAAVAQVLVSSDTFWNEEELMMNTATAKTDM